MVPRSGNIFCGNRPNQPASSVLFFNVMQCPHLSKNIQTHFHVRCPHPIMNIRKQFYVQYWYDFNTFSGAVSPPSYKHLNTFLCVISQPFINTPTRSPPAPPHCLQNQKWLLGGFKMADGVFPEVFGSSNQLWLNKFFDPSTPSMRTLDDVDPAIRTLIS